MHRTTVKAPINFSFRTGGVVLAFVLFVVVLQLPRPIHATEVAATPVSFSKQVLPLLQKNCLACHNESEYEGELILESVEQLLDGGDSGPAVIVGKAEESLVYQLASHQAEPVMPPVDNDVGAKRFSAEELAILKSWIDNGAKDTADSETPVPAIDWRPIPDELAEVLALELSPNGRWLATGRGNQLMIYSVPLGRLQQTLVDPSLVESHGDSAHLDSVQSIAWSPDQTLIASGGYRVVKIWKRKPGKPAELTQPQVTKLSTPDESRVVELVSDAEKSMVKLSDPNDQKELALIASSIVHQDELARAEFEHGLRTQALGVAKSDLESAKKRKIEAEADAKKATDELAKASNEVSAKQEALANSQESYDQHNAAIEAEKVKQRELTEKVDQLAEGIESAADADKAKLQDEKNVAEMEQKRLAADLANKEQELKKQQTDVEKKAQELADAKKSVERARAAEQRLEEIVGTRQSQIEQAQQELDAYQEIVDQSTAGVESVKQQSVSPWVHVRLAADDQSFSVFNEAGDSAQFATTDGALLSIEPASGLGAWELIQTIGNVNGDSPGRESPFADRVTALAFRHDGQLLAVGGGEPSRSGEVQLWDTNDWTQVGVVEDIHSDVVYDLQFAPLGNNLASCGSDRMVKLIDSATAKHVRTFEGHTGHVLGVSWRADGRTLATAGADQVVKVWDAVEGGQRKTISGFKGEVTAVRYLGLEDRFVFSTGTGDLHSRDSEGNGKPGFGKLTDYVHRLSCSRDGKVLAAAGTNRTVRVWNAEGKQIAEFK